MKIKSRVGKFNEAPWQMSKRLFEEFIQVTPKNITEFKKMGRLFYIIEVSGEKYKQYQGYIEIGPRLIKGRMCVKSHPHFQNFDQWIQTSESVEEWKERYVFINKLVESGRLFIREKEGLVKYSNA